VARQQSCDASSEHDEYRGLRHMATRRRGRAPATARDCLRQHVAVAGGDEQLEQARFEAARAHRQYDQIDPDNRLVAGELERRWNERLANVRVLEEQLSRQRGRRPSGLKNTARPAVVPSAATCPHRRTTVPPAVFTQWEMKRMLGTVPDISSDYCRTPDRQTTNLWVGRSNRSGRANFIFKDKDLAERNFSSLTRAANWSRICRVFAAWRFARLSSS
jgi:hypothetical protein